MMALHTYIEGKKPKEQNGNQIKLRLMNMVEDVNIKSDVLQTQEIY